MMHVGEIYKSKRWGDVVVLEYTNHSKITVKFLNSGNIDVFRSTQLKSGEIRDRQEMAKKEKRVSANPVSPLGKNSIYKTNKSGDVIVLEYRSSLNVLIEFVETGNQYTVQKDAILRGLVRDSKFDAETTARIKKEKSETANLVREKEVAEREAKARAKEDALQVELLRREYEAKKRDEAMMAVVYTSEEFGEYSISQKLSNNCFEVTFADTGGKSVYSMYNLANGKVFDTARYTHEQLLAREKEIKAGYYQRNREKILEQVKQYQKANPEKARVRNRNRRARRVNAEGTHTLSDTDLILSEQGNKCAGCSCELDDSKHLDHYVPLISGGTNSPENLQWLCQFCNNSKSGKDPMTWLEQIFTKAYQARRAAAALKY